MRIILEGCDGVGKTTLAKILADKYGLDICHCGITDPCDYNFYKQSIRKDNVVWDRHTLGELIYPSVFDRRQKLSAEDARLVIHYAKLDDTKIFVLTADHDIIKDRLLARGDEHEKIMNTYEWIDNQFKFYAKNFYVPVIDTSKMTLTEIFNLVEKK